MDHSTTGIVRAAPVLQRGLDVMGQSPRPWVKLARAPTASSSGGCDSQARIV